MLSGSRFPKDKQDFSHIVSLRFLSTYTSRNSVNIVVAVLLAAEMFEMLKRKARSESLVRQDSIDKVSSSASHSLATAYTE